MSIEKKDDVLEKLRLVSSILTDIGVDRNIDELFSDSFKTSLEKECSRINREVKEEQNKILLCQVKKILEKSITDFRNHHGITEPVTSKLIIFLDLELLGDVIKKFGDGYVFEFLDFQDFDHISKCRSTVVSFLRKFAVFIYNRQKLDD